MTACCCLRRTAPMARPDDLKALVDAAHRRGLMVFLDVVYNHFGPEGNYLRPLRAAVLHARPIRRGATPSTIGCPRCGVRDRERAALAQRLSLRRPAPRRGACHRRAGAQPSLLQELSEAVGTLAAADRTSHPSGAGERRQPGEPARSADRSAARQISRAMERRLSSRLPRAADRRDHGLLRRLSRRRASMSRGRLAEGFAYQGEPSPHREGAPRGEPTRRPAGDRVRQFPAEPRPDRQPRAAASGLSELAPAAARGSRPRRSRCFAPRRR